MTQAQTGGADLSLAQQKELVRLAKDDLHHFQTLYNAYFSSVYHYCYFHSYSQPDAEDLTSDIFMKALKAFEKFEWQDVSFKAWLMTIASNTVKNYWRDRKVNVDIDKIAPDQIVEDNDFLEMLSQEERRLVISQLLQNLKPPYKDVLILRFYEKMRYQEIAQVLDKSEAACKMQTKRALEALKKELIKQAPEIVKQHEAIEKAV